MPKFIKTNFPYLEEEQEDIFEYNELYDKALNSQINYHMREIEALCNAEESTELSTVMENLVAEIVTITNEQQVNNLNILTGDKQFPAIDLLTSDRKVAFQISITNNPSNKLAKTRDTFLDFKVYHSKPHNFLKYQRYQKYFDNIKRLYVITLNSKSSTYFTTDILQDGTQVLAFGIDNFIYKIQRDCSEHKLQIARILKSALKLFENKTTVISNAEIQMLLTQGYNSFEPSNIPHPFSLEEEFQ